MNDLLFGELLSSIFRTPETERPGKTLLTDWILNRYVARVPLSAEALLKTMTILTPHLLHRVLEDGALRTKVVALMGPP